MLSQFKVESYDLICQKAYAKVIFKGKYTEVKVVADIFFSNTSRFFSHNCHDITIYYLFIISCSMRHFLFVLLCIIIIHFFAIFLF